MKWLIVAAVALLLVVACVVYYRSHHPPVLPPVIGILHKPAKPAKPFVHKAKLPGPVDISGPLKDRALVQWVLPEYPEWALEQGIGGVVLLKIRAGPDGLVKSFIELQQMSGDQRLDEEAEAALQQWKFEEKPDTIGIQWGVVTIRFKLLPKAGEEAGASVRGIALNTSASGVWECVHEWVGDVEKHLVYICRLKKA